MFEYAGKRWGICEIHGGVIASYVLLGTREVESETSTRDRIGVVSGVSQRCQFVQYMHIYFSPEAAATMCPLSFSGCRQSHTSSYRDNRRLVSLLANS